MLVSFRFVSFSNLKFNISIQLNAQTVLNLAHTRWTSYSLNKRFPTTKANEQSRAGLKVFIWCRIFNNARYTSAYSEEKKKKTTTLKWFWTRFNSVDFVFIFVPVDADAVKANPFDKLCKSFFSPSQLILSLLCIHSRPSIESVFVP